jgi:UDP-N-acetylmuramyl tripeptide synthase
VRGSSEDNPGRGNLYDVAGVRVLVDFVHNAHGLDALAFMVRSLGPRRLLLVLGHAGDRDDEAVRALARAGWRLRPDRVVVKELRSYLRGRSEGEVPALIVEELRNAGASSRSIDTAFDEIEAARKALAWAGPGDLVILPTHEDRDGVEGLLRDAGARPL